MSATINESTEPATLNRIRVVLVNPSHPGNIGAVARAMWTMGLGRLHLVQPKKFPHAEATAMAAGATTVLDHAQLHESLADAIAECGLVLATSARDRTIAWPTVNAREGAQRAVADAAQTQVAVVFGAERVGLTNDQLDRCHALIQIPANPAYSSLNIASAAQVLCYELRMAALATHASTDTPEHVPAPAGDVDRFHTHLEQVMLETKFLDPANPRQLDRRVRRMFHRMRPDTMELNILRGILTAVQDTLARSRKP